MSAVLDIIAKFTNQASPGAQQLARDLGQVDKAAEQSGGSMDGASNRSKLMGSAMTVAAGAGLALGTAVVGIGVAAARTADDMNDAVNTIQVGLGATREEAEALGEVAEDVWRNNFAGSIDEAAQAIVIARQQLGDLADGELQSAAEAAFRLRDSFGVEIPESMDAASTLMEQFGLTSEEAFDFISSGFQRGLDRSGDFLDTIGEYSVQFAAGGADAGEFFSLLESGLQGGVLGTDKAADAFKEFRVRIQDGSTLTAQSLDMIGISSEQLSAQMRQGTISAADAFQMVVDALGNVDDKNIQMQAGVGLLGTQFEDLGTEGALALSLIGTSMEDLAGATESLDARYNTLGDAAEGFKRTALAATLPIGEAMLELANAHLPAVESALERLTERLEDMEPAIDAMSGANDTAVDEIIAGNLQAATSVEGLKIEYEKISNQLNMYGGLAAAATGTTDALRQGQEDATLAIAREAETLDEFLAIMQEIAPTAGLATAARQAELTVLYEHEQVMLAALAVQAEEERIRNLQTAALERMTAAQIAAAAAERAAYEATPEYIGQQEQLNEQMERYATQLAEGPTVIAAFEAEQLELAAAADVATEAMRQQEAQLGGYFDAALTATGQADSFEMQLYEAGAAAGLGADQLRILAGATGEYTEAEIEAAFQSALMKANIDELVASVQDGTITANEAVVALGALKSGQETTAAGAIGLAAEMSAGAAALAEIRDRANEATAAVNAIPTSHNVHYTSSGSVDPPGSIPGGGNAPGAPPQAFAAGGWTGDYGGIVHPNELVIPTDVVRSGAAGILGFAQQHVPGGVSGGGGITIQIDARGSVNATAVEDAGYRGAKRALQEAGVRADIMRRAR